MIFKMREPVEGLECYVRRDRLVYAKRMEKDFQYETGKGWQFGKRGDWIVKIDDELWTAIEDEQFKRVFKRFDPEHDCHGPCRQGPSEAEK